MRLHFYTRNLQKIELLRRLLAERSIQCEVVQEAPPPEIQAPSCEQVVQHTLASARRLPAVAEDSGLFIPALGGFPGTITSYIQQTLKPPHLLHLLEDKPREAFFRSVIALRLGEEVRLFTGEMHGSIAERCAGDSEHWLDTLFIPRGETRTLAQLSQQEKFEISDWKQSFGALVEYLTHTLSP